MRGIRGLGFVLPLAAALVFGCSPEDGVGPYPDGGGDRVDTGDGGCTSSAPYCATDGRTIMQCDPSTGSARVVRTCPDGQACIWGECRASVCRPGQGECLDDTTSRRCLPDGSGYENVTCEAGTRCNDGSGHCEAPCNLRMFILVDQSGSMSDLTPTKWEQARQAVHALMTSPTAAEIEFGFGAFPTDGNCGIGGVVLHPVPAATSAVVDSYFSSRGPNGNTPLASAFETFLTDTTANLNDPAYHNSLLVVSDGVDTCLADCVSICGFDFACLMACESDSEAITAGHLAETARWLRDGEQIRSFVIGFGSGASDVQLTAIAANGGTALGRWIPAGNVDELTAALQTVVDEMFECNDIIIH